MIEAPALGTPTVNVGLRQRGRERSFSVIDCGETESEIHAAIIQSISVEFLAKIKKSSHPFGDGYASVRIAEVLRAINLEGIIFKDFYDQPVAL